MSSGEHRFFALGSELRRLRNSNGIPTQSGLASLLGIAQQTVARWEAGSSRPRADQIARIANVLRTEAKQLLTLSGHVGGAVTTSFDQPLPLPSLSPESFQNFCRSLLSAAYTGARVHAFGKTGHTQFGVDIQVRTRTSVLSFQCKREGQFGAAKVRKAVKEHKLKAALKVILLARVASPGARREVARHRGWRIWDQVDLSDKLRELPVDAKRRLVDTFFPGQRFALLGEAAPGPWLSPEEFFAPLLLPDRPFNHHWSLVGRTKERGLLRAALSGSIHRVTCLVGPPGGGKSRLLRTALQDFSDSNIGVTVLMLSPTDQVTMKTLEDLGGHARLLVVDDAHDRTDLDLLIRHCAQPEQRSSILLAYRPYAQDIVDRHLGAYGLEAVSIKLERPTKTDALSLATQVLKSLGGPLQAAESISDFAYDSPLSVVVSSWLVSREGLRPDLFGSHVVFRQTVLSRYRDAIAGSVASNTRDQDLVYRILQVIALVQPIVPDDPALHAILESSAGVRPSDTTRLTKALVGSGVLFKRGARYRLSPDLLADSIIESAYVTADGHSNGEAERFFTAANASYKANLFLNLGRLDWRRNVGDTSRSHLLDALWRQLEYRENHADLHAAIETAYYQPAQALTFARRLIAEGHGQNDDVCRLIRNAAYSLAHVDQACELLWELGHSDNRRRNQYPSHPIRLLSEMAAPEPHVPLAYIERVVDFVLSMVPREESWTGVFTPFDVLASSLATEGHFTSRATSRSVTLTAYGVEPEGVRPVRDRIIKELLVSLSSDDPRRAYQAGKVLQNAIHGPMGLLNRRPSDNERSGWFEEFERTLEGVERVLQDDSLTPVVAVRVANSVAWHARNGIGGTKERSSRIVKQADRDLETRVTRLLMDGWGLHSWATATESPERIEMIQDRVIRELSAVLKTPERIMALVNKCLRGIAAAGDETSGSSQVFLNRLLLDKPELARVVMDLRVRTPLEPIAAFASAALAVLLRHRPDEARQLVKVMLATGPDELPTVARAYALGLHPGHALATTDLAVVRDVFRSQDSQVLANAPWLLRSLAEIDGHLAIELLAASTPAAVAVAGHEMFMWLDDSKLIPLEAIDDAALARILDLLLSVPRLDDHFVQEFLRRVTKRAPSMVVELGKRRMAAALATNDWSVQPIGLSYLEGTSLGVLDHDEGPALLRDLLDWARPQIDDSGFAHRLADLVLGLFGSNHPMFTSTLQGWMSRGTVREVKVVGRILREAQASFVFDEQPFVSRVLSLARGLDMKAYRDLGSSLFASAIGGLKSGVPGEPFPEDLQTKAKAELILAGLSKGEASFQLYDDLRKYAASSIERSFAEGRAMAEADADS